MINSNTRKPILKSKEAMQFTECKMKEMKMKKEIKNT